MSSAELSHDIDKRLPGERSADGSSTPGSITTGNKTAQQSTSPAENPTAAASLMAPHQRWLRTVIRSRVNDETAVDDVYQNVVVAALGSPTIDPEQIAPWLYRVAIRQALLYRRKQGRQRKAVADYARRRNGNSRQIDPLNWLLGNERDSQLRQALQSLADADREIFLLKYSEGWTYRQLAEHLGVSVHTIEHRLWRTRRQLRHLLTSQDCAGEKL